MTDSMMPRHSNTFRRALMLAAGLVAIQAAMSGCSTTGPETSSDTPGADEIVVTGSRVRSDGGAAESPGVGRVASGPSFTPPPPAPPPPPARPEPGYSSPAYGMPTYDAGAAVPAAPPVAMAPPPSPVVAPPGAPAYGPSQQAVQSGILTAGEYDDLQNPIFYNNYVDRRLRERDGRSLPYIDTRQAVTVTVTDPQGRPVPFATIEVDRAEGADLRLTTVADGTVALFPSVDRLAADTEVRLLSNGRVVDRQSVRIGRDRSVSFRQSGSAQAVQAMDLLLVVDATGSMGDEMNYLKAELEAIVSSLKSRHAGLDVRVGLIVYRDEGDEYVVRDFPFTSDVSALQQNLAAQYAQGGGDYPEAMDQALARAVRYPWRENAVNVMLLVADAPPHDNQIQASWDEVLRAREERVHILPIAGSGVHDTAEFVMRAAAAATQSRYLFLTDDSGVGGAHQEPEAKCYAVTRLDSAVRRVLDSLISGQRMPPSEREIIRTVGPYNNGNCDSGYRQ